MLSGATETGAATVLAVILVWSTLGGAAVGVVAADRPTSVPGGGAGEDLARSSSALQISDNETNSSSTRHENPIGADEDSDTDEVAAHLADSLANRINGSTVELSRGEYERAESLVDDQYQNQLSQYVDIAGSSASGVDPETLQAAGQNQRRIVNDTREFNEAYEAYEEARRAGDTERARRLARELTERSENISQTTQRQQQNLQSINNSTTANLNETIRETRALNQSVSERQQEAIQSEFVETELDVETDGQRASFSNPLLIRGQLTTANGTVLADRSVTIAAGNRNYTVLTDSRGQFSLGYRPTTVRIDSQAVTVQYVPADTSVYRSASGSVPMSLEQTNPSVSLGEVTTSVRYGETVAVRGRVTAGSVPIPNVPVAVSIGDTEIDRVRTDEDGSFEIRASLPAGVSSGEQSLDSRVLLSDRAVAAQNESADITIVETGTNLSLTSVEVAAGAVAVSGQLTTDDGTPVSGQQVALGFNSTTVTTGTTDQDGTIDLNASVDDDEIGPTSTLTLRYDGSETSLNSTVVRQIISLGTETGRNLGSTVLALFFGSGQTSFGPAIDAAEGTVAVVVGLVLVAFIGSGLYVEFRRLNPPSDAPNDSEESGKAVTDTTGSDSAKSEANSLDAAVELLDQAATDDAVQATYFAVRNQISGTSRSVDPSHWRYYESLNGALDDSEDTQFYRLTELYEYAAFAERETTSREAREAVEVGASIMESLEPNGTGGDETEDWKSSDSS